MIERLPLYMLAKATHTIPPLPMNYTLGLTYKCNSRCKTCRIYEKSDVTELTVSEWRKVFKSLGTSPYWVTFTGGEPFLYPNLSEVYYDLCETCHPKMINIPTNGLLTARIVEEVWQLCKMEPRTHLTVNVSIDHYDDRNDEIRGISKSLDKAVATVKGLQDLNLENLDVGVHTVISKFNVDVFPLIYQQLIRLPSDPSLYITEIAENRNELCTMNLNIVPTVEQYENAVKYLKGQPSLKGMLRNKYYKLVVEWLKSKTQPTPCYAGYASCQITPDGNVWFCCVNALTIGNVREKGFDDIWSSAYAQSIRSVQSCSCPLANASYTNILLNPKMLLQTVMGK